MRIILFFLLTFSFLSGIAQLPDLIPFRKGNSWGYADTTGNIRIPCNYDQAGLFKKGSAVVKLNGKTALINKRNVIIVPFGSPNTYIDLVRINELIFIKPGNSTEISAYDTSGKKLPELNFLPLSDEFSEGTLPVKYEDGSAGFVGKDWKPLIKQKFHDARPFHKGIAAVNIGGSWGYINKKGIIVIKPAFQKVYEFDGDLVLVTISTQQDLLGYESKQDPEAKDSIPLYIGTYYQKLIDRQGKTIYSFQETISPAHSSGEAICKMNYLIRKKKGEYKNIERAPHSYSEGLSIIEDNNALKGYINKKGDLVIPPAYKDASPFSEGLSTVWNNKYSLRESRCEVIDKTGKEVIPLKHHSIWMFQKGLAVVDSLKADGKYLNGIIDTQGRIRVPFKYESLDRTEDYGLFLYRKNPGPGYNSGGYVDVYGREYFD